MTTPFLSLCLIVRDCEHHITRLLESVRGMFDEIVVVDTGSVDGTREAASRFFFPSASDMPGLWPTLKNASMSRMASEASGGVRVVFSTFDWIDDFAAARNYAFSLSSATWRMYLDADDTLEYRGEAKNGKKPDLRATIAATSKRNPKVNAIQMPYEYQKGVARQDLVRAVRWEDGFYWVDEIHESLEPAPGRPRVRTLTQISDMYVVHHKTHAEHEAAFARNKRIIEKIIREQPNMPVQKRAKMAYHLAVDAQHARDFDLADRYYAECADLSPGTSYFLHATIGRITVRALYTRDFKGAEQIAGMLTLTLNAHRVGFEYLGWVYTLMGRYADAARCFDDARSRQEPIANTAEDVWFTRGLKHAAAGLAYIHTGRIEDAEHALERVEEDLREHFLVCPTFVEANRRIAHASGFQRLKHFLDFLLWDTEPSKVLEVLDHCVPAAFANTREVQQLKHDLLTRLPHLQSWEAYKKAYAEIPDDVYHTAESDRENVLGLKRAQTLFAWAEKQPKDGPPIRVCAIGFQDGDIEAHLLDMNPRFVVQVCDVAPQSNVGLTKLKERYGDRVTSHTVVEGPYDWCANGDAFDVVTIFEVLEHLPQEHLAMLTLRHMVRKGGVLFLSTPIADRWIEPYLTDAKRMPAFYGHVRAHNYVSLHDLFRDHDLTGDIVEGWDGTFVATMRAAKRSARERVAIVVPHTPNPFDGESPLHGFMGGSEEAVVFLAEALRRQGKDTTVFCPPHQRDNDIVRTKNGVVYRNIDEFFPLTTDYDNVIFWRCPEVFANEWVTQTAYQKFLWLHDMSYDTKPELYAKADGVFVLSENHRQSLARFDGYRGHVSYVKNGIVEDMFPDLGDDSARDEHKVIYASSPDRGLETLLDMWPDVRSAVPDATLDIYYDWTNFRQRQPEFFERLIEKVHALSEHGVQLHGGVDHPTLHAAFRRANVWAYPYVGGGVETFCITAVKAVASGCVPLIFPDDALPETLGRITSPMMATDAESFCLTLRNLLMTDMFDVEYRKEVRARALAAYGWDKVAEEFVALFQARADVRDAALSAAKDAVPA